MDDMLEKSGEQMSAVPAFDSHPLIRRYPSMAGLLRAIAEKTVERSLSGPRPRRQTQYSSGVGIVPKQKEAA